MTPRVIPVTVDAERCASAPKGAEVITENSDFTVVFTIDSASGFDLSAPLTAVFVTARGEQTVDFTGGSAAVPVLCRADGSILYIGLTQGNIKTTTNAKARIRWSVKAQASGTAPSADSGAEETVAEVDGADLVKVNDVTLGKWVKATISTIAARVKTLIGVFTSTSAGLVPPPGAQASAGDVLHADGSWSGAGGGGGAFFAEFDVTPGADILAAANAEKMVMVNHNSRIYILRRMQESTVSTSQFHQLWFVCTTPVFTESEITAVTVSVLSCNYTVQANNDLTAWSSYTDFTLPTASDIDGNAITVKRTGADAFANIPYNQDITLQALLARLSGWYTAIDAKQDALTYDAAPTADSPNALTSGAVYDAIIGAIEEAY